MLLYREMVMMIILCAFVTYSFQQKDSDIKKKYADLQGECAKKMNTTLDYVTSVWKLPKFPNDPVLKCFFKCVYVELGAMDENGQIDEVKFKHGMQQLTTSALTEEVLDECKGLTGADGCETAFNLMSCILAAILD